MTGVAKQSVTDYVFDASAILAILLEEQGAEKAKGFLAQSRFCSSVNVAEVIARLTDYGLSDREIDDAVSGLRLDILGFDSDLARNAGLLRRVTRQIGLSLGDRACLATAAHLKCAAVTADRIWASLPARLPIRLVR
jgi:PIN domain nuclease of toxin-antitoxin system